MTRIPLRRGDVVLVQFPFSSGTGQKRRPAVVVQNDELNARLSNTIVVQITGNTRRADLSTQVSVDPSTPEGQSSGLKMPSVVNGTVVLTIEQTLIARRIGRLDEAIMNRVDLALAEALGLS